MPNTPIITPKALAIILLANAGQEVGSFIVQIPEQLLIEAQSRAINFGIQYGAMAIGQAAIGSKFVDPTAPAKLFSQGFESLLVASTPEEAASRGTIAAATLILSAASSGDPNVSMAFGGFLLLLVQNILLPGSQVIFSNGLLKIYIIKNILIRVIIEIRSEIKRKKLGLPRSRFKLNLFKKKEERDFVFKYLRFKKRKTKIFSRNITLFIPYQKELIIKQPAMVKANTI
jgi:hypothetical protein